MDFNNEPYYDDFEASNGAKENNYMRILFRPGYAVQARELTQIQSILQNQLKNFGNHIFKNGSPVYGGHITVDSTAKYIKLQPAYNGVDIDIDQFTDKVVLNYTQTETVKKRARVVALYDSVTNPTLIVRYLRGTEFDDNETIQTPDEAYAVTATTDSGGNCSVANIDEGVFYVDGYFVYVSPQTIVLDPYGISPSYRIGLEISDDIIDESLDTNLLDPAQSSFNYQAPGAHRYQFALNLSKRALDSIDDAKFFELLRVVDGVVTKRVSYPIYSEIDKALARRASDASGDFVVSNFPIKITANSADLTGNTVNVELEAGKAYIGGYEYESAGVQKLILNKARTKANVADYDLSLEYDNYLFANNFNSSSSGIFDITSLPVLDLHCVPSANINTASSSAYYRSYMGSVRVMNFDHDTSSNYILSINDLNVISNTVTIAVGDATSQANNFKFPNGYSDLTNAYANVSIKIIDGPGDTEGSEREIVDYNPSNRIATLDKELPTSLGAGNVVSLIFKTKDIESVVQPTTSKTSLYNSMDISADSRYGTYNYTQVIDPDINSLIFPLPETAISNTDFTNIDYYHKFQGTTSTVGDSKTISPPEVGQTYFYGTDGQNLSTTTANDHLIVVVTANTAGSPYAIGTPVTFNKVYGSFTPTVTKVNDTQLTINFDSTNAGTSGVTSFSYIISVKSSSIAQNLRSKTVYPVTEITELRSTDSASLTGTGIVDYNGRRIDTANGFVWFTDYSKINQTPNLTDNLYVPDVYKIVKVIDSGNPSLNPDSTHSIDITNRYYLDSGQTLAYYDHSKLKLKPGASGPKGRIVVLMEYYKHNPTQSGYFNAESYPAEHYASNMIPIFRSSTGVEYNLRDCFDLRPSRGIGSITTWNGTANPLPEDPMELSYAYYVPRIDKVVVSQEKGVYIVSGVPSKVPVPPAIPSNSLELYKLNIPAYTDNISKIGIVQAKNRRYTMKDIGVLESRIEDLEYYTALSISERNAKNKSLLYSNQQTEKDKYGILVDNFTDFSKADIQSPDFLASIEFNRLAPYAKINNLNMEVSYFDSGLVRVNNNTVTLPYTETPAVQQLSATANTAIQGYTYGMFTGALTLVPESDEWFSDKFQSEYLGELYPPQIAGQTYVSAAQVAVAEDKPAIEGYTPLTILNLQNQQSVTSTINGSSGTGTLTSTTTSTSGSLVGGTAGTSTGGTFTPFAPF